MTEVNKSTGIKPSVFNRLARRVAALARETYPAFFLSDPEIRPAMNKILDPSEPVSETFLFPFTSDIHERADMTSKMVEHIVTGYNAVPGIHADLNSDLMWAMTPAGDGPVTLSKFLLNVKEDVELSARFLALADQIKGREDNTKFNAHLQFDDNYICSRADITVVIRNSETGAPTILRL
jgi:hypothetical protein